ncbi:MAG: tetratricopeptide repeat protein [Cytophagales bacterium]|nr:MAG: tetratricopeptide repeat protein [Cytophagales bacterium]TAF59600.1 MAG: tetratricopeptide repeat protein [Cytophagales bacterium]
MRFIAVCLLCFLSLLGQAQNRRLLDSLNLAYQNAPYDTLRVVTLCRIAQMYNLSNPDTSISLAERALAISEKINSQWGTATSYNSLGAAYQAKSKLSLASEFHQKSYQIREQIADNAGMAQSLQNLGIIQAMQGQHSLALEYFKNGLKIRERLGDKASIGALLGNISNIYITQGDYPRALETLEQSLKIFKESGNSLRAISITLGNIGRVYSYQNNYSLALEYFQKALKIQEEMGDKSSIAIALNNISTVLSAQGNYASALEYLRKGLKVQESIGDKRLMAACLTNIAVIYNHQSEHALALEYYQKSRAMSEEIGNKESLAIAFNGLGNTHHAQGDFAKALEYLEKGLKISEEINNKRGINAALISIGDAHRRLNNYSLSEVNYEKGLKIAQELGLKDKQAQALYGLASLMSMQKNYDKSIEYGQKSLQIATEVRLPSVIRDVSQALFEVYKSKGDYVKALEYHELYKTVADSLLTLEKAKAIGNLEAKAELEKQEKEIALLNKDKELDQKAKEALAKDLEIQRIELERQQNAKLALEKQAEADRLFALARQEKDKRKQDSLTNLAQKKQLEADNLKAREQQLRAESEARRLALAQETEANKTQQLITYLVLFGFLVMTVLAYFIYRSRQQEKKIKEEVLALNQVISQKKDETEVQAEELLLTKNALQVAYQNIQEKNSEVTASINYAKRIQNAVLTAPTNLNKLHTKAFMLFKPRDIVSGDFYWFAPLPQGGLIVAAVDCTGHGVPGAFMSMIGHEMLTEIYTKGIHSPGLILDRLTQGIYKALHQNEENGTSVRDGMDIAILALDGTQQTLRYAGAKNPLFLISNHELIEFKANKSSIGGRMIANETHFVEHLIPISSPSSAYIFSDGYKDQFGGPNNKRFSTKAFKEVLLEIYQQPENIQAQRLGDKLLAWQGDRNQIDDILVIGLGLTPVREGESSKESSRQAF